MTDDTPVFKPLADWQRLTGKSDAAVGRLIEASRWKIRRAKRGEQPLPMKDQLALEPFTGIKPAQWADFYAKVVKARPKPVPKAEKKRASVRAAA